MSLQGVMLCRGAGANTSWWARGSNWVVAQGPHRCDAPNAATFVSPAEQSIGTAGPGLAGPPGSIGPAASPGPAGRRDAQEWQRVSALYRLSGACQCTRRDV